jgi:hypothetical protein
MIVISDRRSRRVVWVTKESWVRAEWEPDELIDAWTLAAKPLGGQRHGPVAPAYK